MSYFFTREGHFFYRDSNPGLQQKFPFWPFNPLLERCLTSLRVGFLLVPHSSSSALLSGFQLPNIRFVRKFDIDGILKVFFNILKAYLTLDLEPLRFGYCKNANFHSGLWL